MPLQSHAIHGITKLVESCFCEIVNLRSVAAAILIASLTPNSERVYTLPWHGSCQFCVHLAFACAVWCTILVMGSALLLKYPGCSKVYLWQYVLGLVITSIALSVSLTYLGAVYRKLFVNVTNTYMAFFTSGAWCLHVTFLPVIMMH